MISKRAGRGEKKSKERKSLSDVVNVCSVQYAEEIGVMERGDDYVFKTAGEYVGPSEWSNVATE